MGLIKDNIRDRRQELGMTLEELARATGVSRQTIHRYESGVISNIPSDKIEKMALALRLTPAHLMGWKTSDDDFAENPPEERRSYYLDPESAKIAQEIYDNPDMRILFDASRKTSPGDLKKIVEMVKIMAGDND